MKDYINRKMFLVLLVLSLLSVACVFPYVLTIQSEVIRSLGQPIGVIFLAQFVQSIILFSITISIGLSLAKKINFKLPLIEVILEKRNYKEILDKLLGVSVLSGIAVAVIIYGLDYFFTILGTGISTHENYAPIWQKLLAAVYGGVTEEILMRLFLMSLFSWISMKLFRQKQPTKAGIVVSIFLAAIIFGLGHLPITASITKINSLVISRAIVLNGVGGIVFGWLFFGKKDLSQP